MAAEQASGARDDKNKEADATTKRVDISVNENELKATDNSAKTQPVSDSDGKDQMTSANAAAVTLRFKGLKSEGSLCMSVFADEKAFPQDKNGTVFAECKSVLELADGFEIVGLKRDLPYAIAIFHDANNNGVMDTKKILSFEAPAEGFGFSQNPGIFRFGPPTFQETSITLSQAKNDLDINVLYFVLKLNLRISSYCTNAIKDRC